MSSSTSAFNDVARIPSAVLATGALATLIQLSTVSDKSVAIIQAAECFAIGIPVLAAVATLSWLRFENNVRLDLTITAIGILFLIFGGYFCVNGLFVVFGMFSARAATLFGSAVAFWSITLAIQLLVRLLTTQDNNRCSDA